MSNPIMDLTTLLQSLQPLLNDGVYVYCSVPSDTDLGSIAVLATFREREGLSVIVHEQAAQRADLPVLFRAAWITLDVNSDLHAVGLTAAVATALSEAGISCNVVAAARHDHIFVPLESAHCAMDALQHLQRRAAK